MRFWFLLLAISLLMARPILAGPPELAFKSAGKNGYEFDTGVVKGRFHDQRISSLVHVPSDMKITQSDRLGIFSYYRIFSSGTRYGDRASGWPTTSKLLPDGAVQVHWAPAEEHPLEMTAIYRWKAADTLDLETIVKPQRDMPRFEVFLSSYVAKGFRGLVYVKPNDRDPGKSGFLPADVNPLVDGSYLIFPRDREAVLMIFDGRWEHPPSPVRWSVTRWLAAPMGMRRHEPSGVTMLMMAPPRDCFAVAAPYNKDPPDGISNHLSLYLSLFGRDLKAGQIARAHSRLVIGQNLGDQRAIELYDEYLKEQEP